MRVLIAVTHLLGTGHLSRALTLARAFAAAGHKADLISGGEPVANLNSDGVVVHQLPSVKSDGVNFTKLLDAQGQPVDDAYLDGRTVQVCSLLRDLAPDVFITELFPFGRRVLKAEFLAMLETAARISPTPIVLASVRDILAPPSKPEKAEETASTVERYYDAVLVHSDPERTPLNISWSVTPKLKKMLAYTGYVAPPLPVPHPQRIGHGEILVTAGGGSVGDGLFEVAVDAAHQDRSRQWRLLVGGSNAATRIEKLRSRAGNTRITIEPTRPDFRQMLHHAAASVSMCGYNTAMDLLQSNTPAVFVPFDRGGEVEQTLRAQSLSQRSGYAMIREADLTAQGLLLQLGKTMKQCCGGAAETGFDGANETVRIAERLLEAHR